ncbi:hypothetical protein RJ641_020864 [Dillenia turbinata]|uniref:Uncharacterized protein n=1 Tax=Dillenia turbinata TaxID=194707 RepID=A0AAN8UUJ9_9MAGN
MNSSWKRGELFCLLSYALVSTLSLFADPFNCLLIITTKFMVYAMGGLQIDLMYDVSDAQWRNFRRNIPILAAVFGIFTLVANLLRASYHLKARGMSTVWLLLSLVYLSYLHGACIIFILLIASVNFLLVQIFAQKKYFLLVVWVFNISVLLCNRLYEGYSFSIFG